MKYIRTKDKIYEIDKDISYAGKEIYKIRYRDFSIIGNGLQKADTIEELCDMFVTLENLDGSVWHSINFTLCDDLRKDRDNEGVYGAIWTDKGLIYIAKMNEDGVLCLI